jgi:hypothetical protein
MTSAATAVTPRSTRRAAGRPVVAFLAGVALAGVVAVGVEALESDAAEPAPTPATIVETVAPSPDGGCLVVDGRC